MQPLPAQEREFNPFGRELPTGQVEKQVRIQLEWIEISQEKYVELMAEPDPTNPRAVRPANDAPLRTELMRLIDKGDAKMLNAASVVARGGQQARVDSIQEMVYPTEYDPPDKPEKDDAENAPKPKLFATPAAFETRNVGVTLEAQAVIGEDGLTVDLTLSPEIVYLGKIHDWGEKAGVAVEMPFFYTMKLSTQVTTRSGDYLMVAVNSPMVEGRGELDPSRKVLVFLKADALVVGLPLEANPKPKAEDGHKAAKDKVKETTKPEPR